MTGEELDAVREELLAREPLFHRSELGSGRADVEAVTVEDFWEVGASGAVYSREQVRSVLERRYAEGPDDEWTVDDAACRHLGGAAFLLTYRLRQGSRTTRRATVWERTADGWRAVYHQGTEAPAG